MARLEGEVWDDERKECDVAWAISGLEEGSKPDEETAIRLFRSLSFCQVQQAVTTGVSDTYAADVASKMMSAG